MGTIISSRIQSEGLNWFGCLEIAENAIEHDILTLQSLFNKLNKNGYIPVTVFTSFKRSIDVYLVYDFAKDDTCSYRALTEFNQMLVGHGLVTSLLLHDSSRRSSNSGYRQRIENATLVVFCLTRRYVDRINDHTRTFPCQSEFHYLSSRKSFLKLLPVVFECIDEKNHDEDRDGDVSDAGNGSGIISGDLDWNNEVCEGPVAVLLGGRSTWSHLPVQLSQGTVGQTTVQLSQGTTNSPDLGQHTNTDVQSTTEEMNIVGSAGRFVAETSRPLPLHELARQGLARQVFHACVRAFVDNAHRAILLQVRLIIVYPINMNTFYTTHSFNIGNTHCPLVILMLIASACAYLLLLSSLPLSSLLPPAAAVAIDVAVLSRRHKLHCCHCLDCWIVVLGHDSMAA